MTKDHLMLTALVVVGAYMYSRSHNSTSAIDSAYSSEAAGFGSMNGTNFTNSVWDSASGQPGYMFGTINVPGGAAVQALQPVMAGSIFGHM